MENGTEYYRENIIEMINNIEDEKTLILIYAFTKSGYNEEKAGK